MAAREAAQRLGISLFGEILESFQEAEYRRVFAAMKQARVAGILVSDQSENMTHRKLVVELATASRLPTLYYREYVELGGLMSYGQSVVEFYHRASTYVDKILKGVNPASLPIDQESRWPHRNLI